MVAHESNMPFDFDRDLQQRVSNFLASRQHASLRRLAVEAKDGVITLRGQVNSFYEKQLSFLLSSRVAGVIRLVDEISVASKQQPLESLLHPQDAAN